MTLALVPFAVDQSTAVALAEAALRSRLAPGEQMGDLLPPLDSAIRSARATGGIVRSEGTARGIVVWEPSGPLGVSVRLLYLAPPEASPESYGALFEVVERAAGPIAFAPGPLAGLSPEEESALMRARGFAPFGRSEMALPPSVEVPNVPVPDGGKARPVHASDEAALARLHEVAYRHHLDRYLALEDLDPVRDANRELREFFGGRYGELLSPGSSVATVDGRIVAAALSVRRTAQVLIIDVMTDPDVQGRGFGRATLADALASLRDHGERSIVLNVTEGNDRAVRLYSGLGFVRSMGPSKEWYDARRMAVRVPPA